MRSAAKAAKELDKSTNAREALKLIELQEVSKQREAEARRTEYEAHVKSLEIQRAQKEGEEARKTLDSQTEHEKRRAEYRDQLERKRYVDQLNAEKYRKEEELRKQEEYLAKQEAIKRKTLEYEAELRQQTELARVKAETEGRIKQERQNHDLRVAQARAEAKEYRETVLEGIKLASTELGKGLQEFLTDKERLTSAAVTLSAVALGVYAAKTSTGVAGRYIEARLGKPSLVRDTSRRTALQVLRNPVPSLRRLLSTTKAEDALKGVVLEKGLTERLTRVAISTANTKANGAPFRNLLLHGPPGTGKTLFAKGLAANSGLDYAILTGGDVAPLGKEAVTEIHKVFDWAGTTRKGVLLFVDEADAFLRRRSTEHMSEELRNALNAFLYRTGEASDKFMVVFASNQPEQFDWAINDRIDEMVDFNLPGEEERLEMVTIYLEKYVLNPPSTKARPITVEGIGEEEVKYAAKVTVGFSGREISKLAIAWQAAAYGAREGAATLDKELYLRVLEQHLASKRKKKDWFEASLPGGPGVEGKVWEALVTDGEGPSSK
jgi:ATPase family AAA domain-containing protein 3A/B